MAIVCGTDLDSLETQLALFREVEAVTREQLACLERGEYAEVVTRLRRRHALLDRLERLVAPPSAPAREEEMIRASAMNDEIGRLLRGIISSDELARDRLEERRRTVEASLDEIRRGRSALAGYRHERVVAPQIIDVTP